MSRSRPFWLPASNYYVLAFAVSAGLFFVAWGVFRDLEDETPWITAGIFASVILIGSVVGREVVLRQMHTRVLRQPKVRAADQRRTGKLTIEANALLLREIQQKSDAANVLNRFSSGHREVFELCSEYMARNEEELKTVGASSPRLAPLLRGRVTVSDLHRFHLLRWAEIESRNLTGTAANGSDHQEQIAAAENALQVIDEALDAYPSELKLLESRSVVADLVISIKVAELIAAAERAAFHGVYDEAIDRYRQALDELARANAPTAERRTAESRVNAEIEKLRALESGA